MLKTLATLRQPRYAALTVLMVLIAAICVLLGTWQIARLGQKVDANGELRHNAHAAPAPVAQLLPAVGSSAPKAHAVQFRRVTATGTYDAARQTYARLRTVDGETGWYVVTPLRTADGTLLVARGFVTSITGVAAPPSGPVTVTARVEPGERTDDRAAQLRGAQVETINPAEQARRLGGRVFDAYGELLAGQPGTAGLKPVPAPDLSNPAGGAVEPQHVAYIIQWYLFALLALAAPLAMARAETRHRDERDFDHAHGALDDAGDLPTAVRVSAEPGSVVDGAALAGTLGAAEPVPEATDAERRAAKLASRYGKPLRR